MTGFGFAIVSAILLGFFLDVRTITLCVLLVGIVIVGSVFLQTTRSARLKIRASAIASPVTGTIAGRFIGVILLKRLSAPVLAVLMAGTLFAIGVYFLLFEKRTVIRPGIITGGSAGLLNGILGGLFNFSAPPMVSYFRGTTHTPTEFIATLQAALIVGSGVSLASYLALGNIVPRIALFGGVGAIGCILGTVLGHRLFLRVDQDKFYSLLRYSVVGISLSLFVFRVLLD